MISIITVNWNSYDWLNILLESLAIYTKIKHEIIVVDNSTEYHNVKFTNVHQVINKENLGHGAGLNIGSELCRMPYTMFLDVDCHALHHHWEQSFLDLTNDYDVIGGRGVPAKPIRPACMFMKTEIAKKYDWRATPNYKGHRITPSGSDVAILAYHQMVLDSARIKFLDPQPSHYGTHTGEEYTIDGVPLFYHHWSGSWLNKRQEDFPNIDLLVEKQKLFKKIPWRIF